MGASREGRCTYTPPHKHTPTTPPQPPHAQSGPIDVSHLKPSQLSNVGLLVATLTGVLGTAPAGSEARELGAINLVVQVVPGDGGVFNRCILNPWEE